MTCRSNRFITSVEIGGKSLCFLDLKITIDDTN